MIGPHRRWAESGALTSYGADFPSFFRIAATQLDQILKGVKPSDIPVQQPAKLELVALGLTIPPALLARADDVIG